MAWVLICVLSIIWGSSFILMKRGLFTPDGEVLFLAYEVAIFRLMSAFVVLMPFVYAASKKIPRKKWPLVILSGFIGNGIPVFLFAFAQQELSSSITGVLNSLTPFFTVLLGMIFFKIVPKKKAMVGVILGLAGAVSLVLVGEGLHLKGLQYSVLILLATICYRLNVNILKKYLHQYDALAITSMSFMVTGFMATILAFKAPHFSLIFENSLYRNGFLYVLLLGVLGTAMALVLFNYLIKISTPVFASSVTYFIPIVAIVWGLVDGEDFGIWQIASTGIIISGVRLIKS